MTGKMEPIVKQVAEAMPWLQVVRTGDNVWLFSWGTGHLFCFEGSSMVRFCGPVAVPPDPDSLARALLAWNTKNTLIRYHVTEEGAVGADVVLPGHCVDFTSVLQALASLFALHLAGGAAPALEAVRTSSERDETDKPLTRRVSALNPANEARVKQPLGFRTPAGAGIAEGVARHA